MPSSTADDEVATRVPPNSKETKEEPATSGNPSVSNKCACDPCTCSARFKKELVPHINALIAQIETQQNKGHLTLPEAHSAFTTIVNLQKIIQKPNVC